jgi:hypothetical protein
VAYLECLNEYAEPPVTDKPIEKYQFASIDELQDVISQIARDAKKLSEQNFIRKQIGEVMSQFGYNLSQEIVFGTSQTSKSYLCQSETKQNAIHVSISGEIRMMIEIVGLGKSKESAESSPANGVFNSPSELDEDKKASLFNEQVAFCDLHPKIIEELSKRGVILNAESRKAPDLRYCREFIPLVNAEQRTYSIPQASKKAVNKQKLREMKI